MRTIFIPAKIRHKLGRKNILGMSNLPRNIAIAYSIQYTGIAKEIKQVLSKKHKITSFTQVLGCSKPRISKQTQAILLIGSGRFHAISLSHEAKLPIYILDGDKLAKISENEKKTFENRQKAAYLKFLNADKIGILISTKPGQENLKKAIEFKGKLKKKKSYLFISNNINTAEFENFGLNSWVNTACPRIDMNDNSVININDLL